MLYQNNNAKRIIKDKFSKKNIVDGDSVPAKDLAVDVNTSSSNSPTAPSISNPITMDTNSDLSCASPNLYGDDETGESFVFVEVSPNAAGKPFRLNLDLFFFESLKDFKLKALTTIKTISNGKAKLSFATPAEANEFVLNNDFRIKPIKAFIPKTFTEKFGIIKNIPPAIKGSLPLSGLEHFYLASNGMFLVLPGLLSASVLLFSSFLIFATWHLKLSVYSSGLQEVVVPAQVIVSGSAICSGHKKKPFTSAFVPSAN
uniref:Uncharacterized protein n=1 Tax=Glossina pallidipes TaxID=7398 RepID=A0A1A9ZXD2_GLOPL